MFYIPNKEDRSQTNFLSVLRIRLKFGLTDSDPGFGWIESVEYVLQVI